MLQVRMRHALKVLDNYILTPSVCVVNKPTHLYVFCKTTSSCIPSHHGHETVSLLSLYDEKTVLLLYRRAYQVPHFVTQIMVFLSEYKNLTLVKLTSNAGIVIENDGFCLSFDAF